MLSSKAISKACQEVGVQMLPEKIRVNNILKLKWDENIPQAMQCHRSAM